MNSRTRVLVVDDSALMRKLIPQMLGKDAGIEVVGTAMDGEFALKKIAELKPDVVTLDLEMPRMDGMETLRQIMKHHRVPVIVVSAHTADGARSTLKALAFGAFDFIPKPQDAASGKMDEISSELASKIKAAATAGVPKMAIAMPTERPKPQRAQSSRSKPTRIVGIGISTGGPNALQYLFSHLPEDFAGSLLVVQHMPDGFTEMFARRLDECSPIEVKEAQSGDVLVAGRALICPGNRHMRLRRMPHGDIVVLSDQPSVNGHRPSVDVLFHSIASELGAEGMAVLMTGMGEDGAQGLGAVKAAGGLTFAQSGETCVVSSMPRAAIERGFASRVVPLNELAGALLAHCSVERAISIPNGT